MGSDLRRSILWVILAAAVFMLWDNWQVYQGRDSFFGGMQPQQAEQQVASSPQDVNSPEDRAGAGADAVAKGMIQAASPVEVETDLVKLRIDRQGAVMTYAELLKEQRTVDWTDVGIAGMVLGKTPPPPANVVLFEVTPKRAYVAQSGLIGGSFPNHKTEFTYVGTVKSKVKDRDTGTETNLTRVVFEAESGSLLVRKTYEVLDGHYGIIVRSEITNRGSEAVSPSAYYQLTRDSDKPEGESTFYYTYTGPAIYTAEDKFQKIKFDDITEQPNNQKRADNGWIAMIQHYFVTAWTDVPGSAPGTDREFYTTKLDDNLYAVGEICKLGTIEPQSTAVTEKNLYVGPQDQQRLTHYAEGLDLVVDYGWLTFLAKPIYWVLNFLHGLVGNWGWAVVLLTCLVKAILYPVSAAGYKSMARMKEVTPRMKQLQEQYGQDKQRYQQELMALYKKEKINPIGGCLPIALQIPVFLALYWVLIACEELRGEAWILWVQDMAMPDPWFILPLLMMATMFLQMKLNPKPTDPMQAKMMVLMPLVFSVMFFFFASGLVLYWLTNNILSILQQWAVNRSISRDRQKRMEAAANTEKK